MSTRIPISTPWERLAPAWPDFAQHLPPLAGLSRRDLGEPVVDHRTSWVRRLTTTAGQVYVKTYEYKSWGSRLRNFGKRTAPWSRPRVVREFDALAWLLAHGFPGPTPLIALVWRRLGFVVRSTLVTSAWPGERADFALTRLGSPEQRELAAAIGEFVGTLHALGFRDRNLDLRNLLTHRTANGWQVAKVDSPRWQLRPPGQRNDALVVADWHRLAPQLATFGLDATTRAAAQRVQQR